MRQHSSGGFFPPTLLFATTLARLFHVRSFDGSMSMLLSSLSQSRHASSSLHCQRFPIRVEGVLVTGLVCRSGPCRVVDRVFVFGCFQGQPQSSPVSSLRPYMSHTHFVTQHFILQVIILEAHSILYAVRFADNAYLPGRLLIFSERSPKDAQTMCVRLIPS